MAKTDIAQRVYNHTWKLDPIVRSLLDTDFYKLLMLQMIWGLYPKVDATFSLINRTQSVRLADEIDEGELRAQLDHARTLRFSKKEMIWLAGNSFYGAQADLRARVPRAGSPISSCPNTSCARRDGQFELTFHGPWIETTMWEIPALAIINELRSRAAHAATMGRSTLDVALCPRQGQDVGEGRAAEEAAGPAHLRFRHAPPPLASSGSAGASRR